MDADVTGVRMSAMFVRANGRLVRVALFLVCGTFFALMATFPASHLVVGSCVCMALALLFARPKMGEGARLDLSRTEFRKGKHWLSPAGKVMFWIGVACFLAGWAAQPKWPPACNGGISACR